MKNNLTPLSIAASFFALLTVWSCHKDNTTPNFTTGKNSFTVTADGVTRNYIVSVPSRYTGQTKTPVVIMCHGAGGDGELFYKISGWKEVGDSLGIITVFPSALSYCVVDDGVMENSTKWNSFPGGDPFCPGQDLKDDVAFMRQMIADLERKYNIDTKRIYMVGFSSGGQFSATCAIQMSDVLAASISCGGGGSFPRDSMYTPLRQLPVMLMFGSKDDKMVKSLGLPSGSAVPMGFDALYSVYPQLYAIQVKPYIDNFKLDATHYTVSGDTNSVVVADYVGLSGNPNNVFKIAEVKGLEHEYPNGINYPLSGALYHWGWFKNYTLP